MGKTVGRRSKLQFALAAMLLLGCTHSRPARSTGTSSQVDSGSNSVSVSGRAGPFAVTTTSGQIAITGASGAITLTTTSGNIEVVGLDGSVTAGSGSIENDFGLRAPGASFNGRLGTGADGSLEVTTGRGNIGIHR